MGSLGPFELILIFLVVLLIFGAKKIPEIARGIGQGINEFKAASREITNEINLEDKGSRQSSRQRSINSPRSPEQGSPAPRGSAYQEAEEPPPEPQHADDPGSKEPREQKA